MKESSFTLKGFINKCKTLLPAYFKELKKSVETTEGLKFSKKVLVDFLKEYFKQNNNKFGRTKFNVNFLNTYLSETLIKNYSGFQPLTNLQIQRIIMNFISFLTLNNVLHKEIEQEIVRMTELADPTEKGILTLEGVDSLSSEEIIKKLRSLGVRFQKEQFLKDMNRFYSASRLANKWEEKYTLTAEGRDLDFVSLSAVVLWDRLAPDVPNLEKIEEMVEEGYDLLDEIKPKAACNQWLKAWDSLKELLPAEIKDINNVNEAIRGTDYAYDWTLDLACYLYNAGLKDEKYHKKRIDYILDVLNRFPNSEDDYTSTMRSDLAETYFLIGEEEKGEKLFKNIIERYPEFLWGYLSWGDQYADVDREIFNYEKAKSIYERALKQIDFHRDDIKSRIKALEKKREGLETKHKIISWYRSSLSEGGLSEKTVQTRIKHIDPFLKYIIFHLRKIYFELIIDTLESDDILDFLGTWIIQQELATSDSQISEFCQYLKSFVTFLFSDNIIPRELLTEFRQICDSEGYFIMLLRKYQDIYKSSPNLKELFPKLQEWEENNCFSKWDGWYKLTQGEEEEEPEKVRLSDEKRKSFGDMKDFL